MFAIGVIFVAVGYALLYHGIDVLAWSRLPDTSKTRPVPLQYLLGVPLPTTPPKDLFHPPFTLTDTDRANGAIALGASVPGNAPGTATAPPGGDTSAGPGTDPGGQTIIPVLPQDRIPNTGGAV